MTQFVSPWKPWLASFPFVILALCLNLQRRIAEIRCAELSTTRSFPCPSRSVRAASPRRLELIREANETRSRSAIGAEFFVINIR